MSNTTVRSAACLATVAFVLPGAAFAGPLSLASHTVSAIATDRSGRVSPSSSVNTFTVTAVVATPVLADTDHQ